MEKKTLRNIPNTIIDTEIEGLMKKNARFDKVKVGDAVKVPPYGRKAKVIEKYPHMLVVRAKNGYKTCFSRGDFIIALGLSGALREKE